LELLRHSKPTVIHQSSKYHVEISIASSGRQHSASAKLEFLDAAGQVCSQADWQGRADQLVTGWNLKKGRSGRHSRRWKYFSVLKFCGGAHQGISAVITELTGLQLTVRGYGRRHSASVLVEVTTLVWARSRWFKWQNWKTVHPVKGILLAFDRILFHNFTGP
jgi:hypothetical protein